jgi:hypothetical protein
MSGNRGERAFGGTIAYCRRLRMDQRPAHRAIGKQIDHGEAGQRRVDTFERNAALTLGMCGAAAFAVFDRGYVFCDTHPDSAYARLREMLASKAGVEGEGKS